MERIQLKEMGKSSFWQDAKSVIVIQIGFVEEINLVSELIAANIGLPKAWCHSGGAV